MDDVRAQLTKTQAQLAEVIDEVVFAEKAQTVAENDLAAFKNLAAEREGKLVECITCLLEYVSVLEHDVIVPAVGSFLASLRDVSLAKARSAATSQLHDCDATGITLPRMEPPVATAASLEARESYLQAKFDPQDAFALASGLVVSGRRLQQLRARVGHTADDALPRRLIGDDANATVSNHAASSLHSSLHVVRLLQAEVEELRSTVDSQRDTHAATVSELQTSNRVLRSKLEELGSVANEPHDYLSKIKAFEMAVHTLNGELAAVEGRAAANDRRHEDEMRLLRGELHGERADRHAERDEYEAMIHRITTEIEKLMTENMQLQQRVRRADDI